MGQLNHREWMGIDNVHSAIEMDTVHTNGRGETRRRLVNATNVDFTSGGDMVSRLGTVQRVSGKHTSPIGFGKWLLAVVGGVLTAYDTANWSSVALVAGVNPVLGHTVLGDDLYLSDGHAKWKLTPSLGISSWGDELGDSTFTSERYQAFPACTKLTSINGRIYGAIDNFVIFTEPYRVDLWDPTTNFYQFHGKVTMLHGNAFVLAVSAEHQYIIENPGTDSPAVRPAFAWTAPDCVPAIDPESKTAYWMGEKGWVLLEDSGNIPKALTADVQCVRRHESAAFGIVKRLGSTMVVSVGTPDAAYPEQNPLMSADFLKSEEIRKRG